MQVYNLLGNTYNKAYRSMLGNIMLSNNGRICFIVVPDKNIMENITLVIFMAAILNFMFYKRNKALAQHWVNVY